MAYRVNRPRKRPARPRSKRKRAAKRRGVLPRRLIADARRAALWLLLGCG